MFGTNFENCRLKCPLAMNGFVYQQTDVCKAIYPHIFKFQIVYKW